MWVHIPTDQVVQQGQPFTFGDTNYPAAYTQDPASMVNLGFTELTRVDVPPEDSAENYYRHETREGAVITATYTRKSDEQIKQQNNSKIDAQIAAAETQQLLPRVVREFLLASAVKEAAALGLTEEQLYAANIGYRKMKDANTAIAALRAQRQ